MVVLALLLLPFVFYWSNSKSARDHNLVDKVVVFVSAPIQWLMIATFDEVADVWHHYVALVGTQEENDRLREENARLKADLVAREEQRIENERLRLLVGLREHAPEVQMTFAHVIATSPTPQFRSVRIDRGAKDGITRGAAVINHDGVVGRVGALTDSYADVMLLCDSNNSTDVLVQRTRARARIRGTGSDTHLGLKTEYLPRTADVEPGDLLITSGAGANFPKGLTVGAVMGVERGAFGLYQNAVVEPAVDFTRLEEVMVITGGMTLVTTFEEEQKVAEESAPIAEPAPASAVRREPVILPPAPPVAPPPAALSPVALPPAPRAPAPTSPARTTPAPTTPGLTSPGPGTTATAAPAPAPARPPAAATASTPPASTPAGAPP